MSILPAVLIVISAILHSTWNMLLKRNKASLASYILMYLPDLVIWGQLQFWTPVDVWHLPPQFFLMVFLSVCCDLTYGKTLLVAYDRMDMSIAYPMMRSLPILFTMCITTLLRLGEPLKWMAMVYSGDGAYILSENEDMAYCLPHQGTNIAVDAMVIPANAKNPKLATVFINYMCGYEASLANSIEVGYASPNAEVLAELSGPGGDYEGNGAYLPRIGYELDEIFVDLPAVWQSKQPDLWAQVMAE